MRQRCSSRLCRLNLGSASLRSIVGLLLLPALEFACSVLVCFGSASRVCLFLLPAAPLPRWRFERGFKRAAVPPASSGWVLPRASFPVRVTVHAHATACLPRAARSKRICGALPRWRLGGVLLFRVYHSARFYRRNLSTFAVLLAQQRRVDARACRV
jgi:hypothetical protein